MDDVSTAKDGEPCRKTRRAKPRNPDIKSLVDYFHDRYVASFDVKPVFQPKDFSAARCLLEIDGLSLADAQDCIEAMLIDQWGKQVASLAILRSCLSKWRISASKMRPRTFNTAAEEQGGRVG